MLKEIYSILIATVKILGQTLLTIYRVLTPTEDEYKNIGENDDLDKMLQENEKAQDEQLKEDEMTRKMYDDWHEHDSWFINKDHYDQ